MSGTVVVPRNGTKHSPNLARWLNKHQRFGRKAEVFRDHDRILWIGWIEDKTWFIGTRIMRALCDGSKAEVGCWSFPISDLTPLPDFWTDYERIGRCVIDTEHHRSFLGDEGRWRVDGETRHCLWCGQHDQHLRRWTETIERTEWLPATLPNTQEGMG